MDWCIKGSYNNHNNHDIHHGFWVLLFQVLPKSSGGVENANATETEVQVTIFNSAPLIFSVPGRLKIQDPGFLQYVTQEALGKYKDMVR